MRLDYYPKTDKFGLWVSRAEQNLIHVLREEHGLGYSTTASTPEEACLLTAEPFTAVSFIEHASDRARSQLAGLAKCIAASRATESQAHILCPADQELQPFQKAGVEYALQRKHCLVGDQPGLGKTMQAIAVANELRARRVLVICPANIRLQWFQRIKEWSTMRWPYHIHVILNGKRGVHPDAAWTVCSYDLASTPAIGAALASQRYDLLILDEAHYLKTIDAGRTRAVFGGGEKRTFEPLASRTERILALTGTPLPNRPREAYTLARSLCHDSIDWLSQDGFTERFNPIAETDNGFRIEKVGRSYELQNRLRAYFMVRREKHVVLPQLKLPIYDLIRVEETGPVKAALEAERLLDIDPEKLAGANADILGQIATARRLMGVAMAPQVADWIDMLFDGGTEKLVVFAWHIEVLNILEKRGQKHGVLRIDGSTSANQKDLRVNEFVKEPRRKLIIGNLSSMGIGTDGLQKVASHCLIAEPDWVPGVNVQAGDRLHRHGQRGRVQIDIFVAPNSLAERVLATALRKAKTIDKTLDRRFGT